MFSNNNLFFISCFSIAPLTNAFKRCKICKIQFNNDNHEHLVHVIKFRDCTLSKSRSIGHNVTIVNNVLQPVPGDYDFGSIWFHNLENDQIIKVNVCGTNHQIVLKSFNAETSMERDVKGLVNCAQNLKTGQYIFGDRFVAQYRLDQFKRYQVVKITCLPLFHADVFSILENYVLPNATKQLREARSWINEKCLRALNSYHAEMEAFGFDI